MAANERTSTSSGPTRRRFLLVGLGGVATAFVAGGAALVRGDWFVGHWITRLIRDHLPGEEIAQAEIDKFIAEVSPGLGTKLRGAVAFRSMLPGVPVPVQSLETKIQEFERELFSDFLVRTTFFFRSSPTQSVKYVGASCSNPFARFDGV